MVKATLSDKRQVVEILTQSFDDNKSVNYIVKQDDKRKERIRRLMEYSFEVCYLFGEVLLSDDKRACALILLPEKKQTTLKSVLLDIRLIIFCIGLANVGKVLGRETKIKKLQPKGLLYYLWFIGVDPREQNKGIGTKLLNEIIEHSSYHQRILCLETSTQKNIPWYHEFGFTIYNELDLGYKLYFMRR
jgi:ribosomal protein S18 acetylase RimI-like enzyme